MYEIVFNNVKITLVCTHVAEHESVTKTEHKWTTPSVQNRLISFHLSTNGRTAGIKTTLSQNVYKSVVLV